MLSSPPDDKWATEPKKGAGWPYRRWGAAACIMDEVGPSHPRKAPGRSRWLLLSQGRNKRVGIATALDDWR